MEALDHVATDHATPSGPPLKQCPFCSGRAEVVTSCEPTRYGVRCVACRAYFLPNLERLDLAVTAWNQRKGTAAAMGGRATAGKCSRRKLAAAKRNLGKARSAKRLKRVRLKTDDAIAWLRPYREAEQLRLEELAARSRSRLETDPDLSRLLNLVRPG